MPEVSVVIPTYNRAAMVVEAVASALAQTALGIEVLVVDDGSTDNTTAVLAPFVAAGQIQVLHQANAGVSAARNTGLRAATAPLVAFLDSDDLWAPTHVATLRAALLRVPEAAIAFSHFRFTGDGDAAVQTSAFSATLTRVLASGFEGQGAHLWRSNDRWRRTLFECGFPFRIQGSMVRRERLAGRDLWFDEAISFTEEAQFVTEVAACGPALFVDEPTLLVRRHEGNSGDLVYGEKMISSYARRVERSRARLASGIRPDERRAFQRSLAMMQSRVVHARAARMGPLARVADAVGLIRLAPTWETARLALRLALSPGRPFPG